MLLGWTVGELAVSWTGHAAALALALAAIDAVRRRRRRAAGLVGVALVGAAPWGVSALEPRAPPLSPEDPANVFTVLVANPFHSPPRHAALIEAIEGSGADLVALLEPPASLPGALAATGRWRVLAEHPATPRKFNVALVARAGTLHPRGPMGVVDARVQRYDYTEAASILAALTWRGRPFTVLVAHPPAPTSRAQQAERGRLIPELAARARAGAPALLLADLNTTRASPVWRDLLARGGLRRPPGPSPASWPSLLGPLGISIDAALVTAPFAAGAPEVVPLPGSDHRGVRVQVALPE